MENSGNIENKKSANDSSAVELVDNNSKNIILDKDPSQ